jgi:hypothetical protein
MQTQYYCYGCSINTIDFPVVKVHVTEFPVVKVHVDELSMFRNQQTIDNFKSVYFWF